jgi:hypothetical protein
MKERAATAISFLLCLGLGWQALRQKAELTHVRLDSETGRGAEQRRIISLQQKIADMNSSLPAKSVPSGSEPAPQVTSATIHLSTIIREHPEYAAIRAKEARRNILYHYSDELAGLRLPPAQLSRLRDLLVERGMRMDDASEAASAAGLEEGSAAFHTAMSQAEDSLMLEMTTLLGTDSRQFLQRAETLGGVRNQIQGSYALDFEDANVPLTTDQARDFAQAIADARNHLLPQETLPNPATGLSVLDQRTLAAAAQILSPAQLQILKIDRIEDNQQMAIARQYHLGFAVYTTH